MFSFSCSTSRFSLCLVWHGAWSRLGRSLRVLNLQGDAFKTKFDMFLYLNLTSVILQVGSSGRHDRQHSQPPEGRRHVCHLCPEPGVFSLTSQCSISQSSIKSVRVTWKRWKSGGSIVTIQQENHNPIQFNPIQSQSQSKQWERLWKGGKVVAAPSQSSSAWYKTVDQVDQPADSRDQWFLKRELSSGFIKFHNPNQIDQHVDQWLEATIHSYLIIILMVCFWISRTSLSMFGIWKPSGQDIKKT